MASTLVDGIKADEHSETATRLGSVKSAGITTSGWLRSITTSPGGNLDGVGQRWWQGDSCKPVKIAKDLINEIGGKHFETQCMTVHPYHKIQVQIDSIH